MPGFIRRFQSFPSREVLSEIEGVAIIDVAPPGSIQGVQTGVAILVGEFADMAFAVAVSSLGVVTTSPQAVDIFSSRDLENKLGGFDSTIGKFGSDGGNGFVELRNKKFGRLVCIPINLASSQGAYVFRDLPTNKSATDPSPVVPLSAGTVAAGREFLSAANRVRVATRVQFSSEVEYLTGVDGDVTLVGGAAQDQTFTSAGSNFLTVVRPDGTAGVIKGDIVVIGQIGGAGALGSNAATYRVESVTDATNLEIQKIDGEDFDWVTGVALPFRIHPGATASSSPLADASQQQSYLIPARPLDATIVIDTVMAPTIVPPAATQGGANPLSGLGMRTDPTTGLIYVATVQAPNAANDATLEVLYDTAMDLLLSEDFPEVETNLLWAARSSSVIRTKQRTIALSKSEISRGLSCHVWPELDEVTLATIIADASPGVGATRDERVNYNWPGLKTFVREAVGIAILLADGTTTTDGILDTPSAGWQVAIKSNLAPERNPAQPGEPVKTVMSPVLGFQSSKPMLGINEYKQLKARGISAPKRTRQGRFVFMSGITSSLTSGRTNQNRRRFADFIQDSVAERLIEFSKEVLTDNLKDAILTEINEFGSSLLSENNKAAQRIRAYVVDGRSGNTPELEADGIYVVVGQFEMIPTADVIAFQAEVGLGVLDVSVT